MWSLPLSRRAVLAATVSALSAAGCRKATDPRALRLGYFPIVTHAPALTGVESGRFARVLGATRLEARQFNAGPAAIEALMAGAIDATYVGPLPAVAGYLRSRGAVLRVISGAASGGALFVVRRGSSIHSPGDLRGKRLATPSLGGTQDLALRRYLRQHGLAPRENGGEVDVLPMENGGALALFRRGQLDGAWVPEPWASRLVAEGGGEVFVDERDLWPGRVFATTVLVARTRYLREAPEVVAALLRAHTAEVAWVRGNPAEAQSTVNRAIGRLSGHPLPAALLASAWARIDFTTDPQMPSLLANARSAQSIGMLPAGDLSGIVEAAAR